MKKGIILGISSAVILGGLFAFSIAQGKIASTQEENLFYYDISRDMKLEVSFYKKVAHLSSKNLGELKLKVTNADSGRSYKNEKNNLVLREEKGKLSIFIGEKNIFQGELQKSKISENIKEKFLVKEIWQWENTISKEESYLKSNNPEFFNLSFRDGKALATTDCADFEGDYAIEDDSLSINNLVETKRFCDNQVGDKFIQALKKSNSFALSGGNRMILFLENNSGSMTFNKK